VKDDVAVNQTKQLFGSAKRFSDESISYPLTYYSYVNLDFIPPFIFMSIKLYLPLWFSELNFCVDSSHIPRPPTFAALI
jgi:hypothetical protein